MGSKVATDLKKFLDGRVAVHSERIVIMTFDNTFLSFPEMNFNPNDVIYNHEETYPEIPLEDYLT